MSEAMEEQLGAQIPAGWKTDPGEIPAAYANLVAVALTTDEVILTFGQRSVSEKEKVGWILPVAKVAIPLGVLPRLMEVLQVVSARQQAETTAKTTSRRKQR